MRLQTFLRARLSLPFSDFNRLCTQEKYLSLEKHNPNIKKLFVHCDREFQQKNIARYENHIFTLIMKLVDENHVDVMNALIAHRSEKYDKSNALLDTILPILSQYLIHQNTDKSDQNRKDRCNAQVQPLFDIYLTSTLSAEMKTALTPFCDPYINFNPRLAKIAAGEKLDENELESLYVACRFDYTDHLHKLIRDTIFKSDHLQAFCYSNNNRKFLEQKYANTADAYLKRAISCDAANITKAIIGMIFSDTDYRYDTNYKSNIYHQLKQLSSETHPKIAAYISSLPTDPSCNNVSHYGYFSKYSKPIKVEVNGKKYKAILVEDATDSSDDEKKCYRQNPSTPGTP